MTRRTLINKTTALGAWLALAISPLAVAQPAAYQPDPTVIEVFAGTTVNASRLPDNVYLRDVNDPDDIIWDRVPAYRIAVNAAPPVHASTQVRYDPQQNGQVYFQVARTSERFYVRMRWHDATQNRKTTVNEFSDGAAVQFALDGADTSFMMGTNPEKPVNIWYWRADTDVIENLAAGGFGSTTELADQSVTGKATYHSDEHGRNTYWQVVMSREIDATGDYQIGLQEGTVPLSLAVWQGEDGQRDGNKLVTMGWVLVDVAPAAPASGGE